jgi:hypothetical protein
VFSLIALAVKMSSCTTEQKAFTVEKKILYVEVSSKCKKYQQQINVTEDLSRNCVIITARIFEKTYCAYIYSKALIDVGGK